MSQRSLKNTFILGFLTQDEWSYKYNQTPPNGRVVRAIGGRAGQKRQASRIGCLILLLEGNHAREKR